MQLTQTIVIIVLVIVGIILFVVLLVELVDIPKPLVVPFADGTIIKIKSLANNLYLRPISCADVATCNDTFVRFICDGTPGGVIISAIGQETDPLTNWQLCQYSSLADTGAAKYLIFSENNQNTSIMAINFELLFLTPSNGICTQLKSQPLACDQTTFQTYFSFILNERSLPGTNTTSGSYNIITSCDNKFIATSGQGATSLPATVCPPIMLSSAAAGAEFGCPNASVDPRCSLSYLFAIEVQS